MKGFRNRAAFGAAIVLSGVYFTAAHAAWEPSRPIQIIVPAGPGGGADQMARVIQSIVTKQKLVKQSVIVSNKAEGAGGEGLLDVKASKDDPHKLVITLSNLFTTPLGTGIPFSWKDLTPVAMMALDEFILWVNAETPFKSSQEYIEAIKKAPPGQFKMGGTGSKQEDQIITVAIEKATGVKFTYIPFRGGGEVAVQLASKKVDSTVNNPIEAIAQWRANQVRPLCVFDGKPLPYKDKVADKSWNDVPTCKSQGLNVEYLMLRGIFMPPGATKEQVDYYVTLMKKVRETREWKDLMSEGAFNQTFITGDEFAKWVDGEEKHHRALMKEAGFLAN